MQFKFLSAVRQTALILCMGLTSANVLAQDADVSKMGHGKIRQYLNENGFKTQSGQVVRVGDTIIIGKGSLPDKRFAFIYQSQTAVMSKTSEDGSSKAYLNSSARGRKAIVKAFMSSGMRKGEYSIFAVVGVGEPINYWIELDNAFETGEITRPK